MGERSAARRPRRRILKGRAAPMREELARSGKGKILRRRRRRGSAGARQASKEQRAKARTWQERSVLRSTHDQVSRIVRRGSGVFVLTPSRNTENRLGDDRSRGRAVTAKPAPFKKGRLRETRLPLGDGQHAAQTVDAALGAAHSKRKEGRKRRSHVAARDAPVARNRRMGDVALCLRRRVGRLSKYWSILCMVLR